MARHRPAGDVDYEATGAAYIRVRRADPRIGLAIHRALGAARTVVNVGAGAGAYEPADRAVVAVEPSAAMRAQRPPDAVPAVDAVAEDLPFSDGRFDAAMAVLSVHQWPGVERGVRELRRVASGPVVILTLDPAAVPAFWLGEYVPGLLRTEAARFPRIDELCALLGPAARAVRVPVPRDCTDGFIEAFYGRPEAFSDASVRAAQSAWGHGDPGEIAAGLARLAHDVESGAWDERHGPLRAAEHFAGSLTLVTGPGRG